jgi:hypothetical protein
MIGFRIMGAVIFVICGIAVSSRLNREETRGLEAADSMIGVIRYIKNMVDMYSISLPKILERMKNDKRCRSLMIGCGYREHDLPENINEMREYDIEGDRETRELFFAFLSEFGIGYREEQIKLCERYETLLTERREKLAAELPVKKKRNIALCVTGTLIPVILLI